MKVKELIEQLKQFDGELDLFTHSYNFDYYPLQEHALIFQFETLETIKHSIEDNDFNIEDYEYELEQIPKEGFISIVLDNS
jgi:hypothetical protein